MNDKYNDISELKMMEKAEMRDKDRIETFIDGVFAIAITLLGLSFASPVISHSDSALIGFFGGMAPLFLGYFLSFFLLGILLSIHHKQFKNIKFVDSKMWWINLIFLSFIVLVPFATSIWTDYSDTLIAILFFHFNMFMAGMILYLNWTYVKRCSYLIKDNVTLETIKVISYMNLAVPVSSAIAFFLAFLNPVLSNLAYAFIAVILLAANRHKKTIIERVKATKSV